MNFTTTIESYKIEPFKIKIGTQEEDIECQCDVEIDQDCSIESVGKIWIKDAKDSRIMDSDDAIYFCIRDAIINYLFDDQDFKQVCRDAIKDCEE